MLHFAESEGGVSGIPNWRVTGLELEAVLRLDDEIFEDAQGFDAVGMVLWITQRIQRHDKVHHRRVDGAEALAVAGAVEHPMFRLAYGCHADILEAAAFPDFEDFVDVVEEDGHLSPAGQHELLAGFEELFNGEIVGRGAVDSDGLHDRQRHDDGARPARHFIEDVAGKQHHFRRHAGCVFTREEAE